MYTVLSITFGIIFGSLIANLVWKNSTDHPGEDLFVKIFSNKKALRIFVVAIRVLAVLIAVLAIAAIFGFFFWIGWWKSTTI